MKKSIAFLICICLLLSGCSSSVAKKTTLNFSYGDRDGIYSGEADGNGLPNGFGTFASQRPGGDKWTYFGEWDHGHWNGRGIISWDNGETYLGEYENDLINGIGMFVSDDGTVTVGNYVNEAATGWCALYLSGDYDGYVFWGNFVDGSATGMLYFPSGVALYATYSDGAVHVNAGGSSSTEPEKAVKESSKEGNKESSKESSKPTEPSGNFTREQAGMCKDFLKHCQYSELHEYISALIADGDLAGTSWVERILSQIDELAALSKKCAISEDTFENETVIYYSGVADISNNVNIVPSLTISNSGETKLEYKLGFKKNGWLFFDEISVVSQNRNAKDQSFDHFDVNRDVIRGGQIQEYVFTSSLNIASFIDDENIIIRFKNSDTRETVDHKLTSAEISAVSTLSQISEAHSGIYKMITNN